MLHRSRFLPFLRPNCPVKLDDHKAPSGIKDSFEFFMPIERMEKSEKGGQRLIQGVASTSDRDLQGEIVQQQGIDYAYFLKYGYINDDHKDGPEHKVGEPIEARMTAAGLWIKAFLYKGKERADYWWEHVNTLAQENSKRKVGFSIQGKILRRDGKTIVKCWLQDVAITASPVNTSTWAEIVKSLGGEKWCLHPWDPVCKGGCCSCSHDEEAEEKALSAGGMGRMLIPQSLDAKAKVQTFKSIGKEVISFNEAVKFLQKDRGYDSRSARVIADAIFATHGSH